MGGRCPPTWVASWGLLGLLGSSWGLLGPLGTSWGSLGASWGPPETLLMASWGRPGSVLGLFGRASWPPPLQADQSRPKPTQRCLGRFWSCGFSFRLGVFLGVPWGRLGGLLGRLGAYWGRLGGVLGAFWGALGGPWGAPCCWSLGGPLGGPGGGLCCRFRAASKWSGGGFQRFILFCCRQVIFKRWSKIVI